MKKIVFVLCFLIWGNGVFAQESNTVLISEVCGSGSVSNSYRDFVELYNPTSADIDLSTWMVKYKSATGSSASATLTIPNGKIIKSHVYFLIALTGSTSAFSGDLESSVIDISSNTAGGGHIALCRPGTTGPAMWQNQVVVDLVGWGTANAPDGTAAPSHPALGGSLERKALSTSTTATMAAGGADAVKGNGYDTNNNSTDFVYRATANPQSSTADLEQPDYLTQFTASYPNVSTITENAFTLNVNVDRKGKAYYVVLPDGATAPSAAQVKSGLDANGVLVSNKGTVDLTAAATNYTALVTGLDANTPYDVYLVAENTYARLQTSPTKVEATTIGVLPVSFTDFTASLSKTGLLKAAWKTASEKNNSHFILQASADGKTWKDLVRKTAAVGGANGAAYEVETAIGQISLAGFGLLGILLLPFANRRYRMLAMLAVLSVVALSCAKDSDDSLEALPDGNIAANTTIYVRLAQVDHDGTTAYSEVLVVKAK